MLTYQQIETIAGILGWTVAEVESGLAESSAWFMAPIIQMFRSADPDGEIVEPGVYYRLSASGYLDCTDWTGPFETEEEAVADMLSVYCE